MNARHVMNMKSSHFVPGILESSSSHSTFKYLKAIELKKKSDALNKNTSCTCQRTATHSFNKLERKLVFVSRIQVSYNHTSQYYIILLDHRS
jgi:hypothetical protein